MSPVAASKVFDFLEGLEGVIVERHEIASWPFGALRRSLRQIVLKLRDSEDQEALDISDRLRMFLSEWLTVPVFFDRTICDAVADLLGEPAAVHARWGSDIRTLYEAALRAAQDLLSIESPMREKLGGAIKDLRLQGRTFKIYCHRQARPHFDSLQAALLGAPPSDNTYLHSVRDYREVLPFDVLIKVGPLRSRGWGSAPDALRTAPRFRTLFQIVWAGCSDEPDFGYDPVHLSTNLPADATVSVVSSGTSVTPVQWTVRVSCSGDDPSAAAGYAPEEDELRIFREINQPRDRRRATLVQIDGQHGILFPPHSRVLSFDPNPAVREAIASRIPSETLVDGMFVIVPNLGNVDLGDVQAEHGHYSQIWKTRLNDALRIGDQNLIKRLRDAGLNLLNLASAMRHWCRPPSTVIHAPQQTRHFEILMRVLGIADHANSNRQQDRAPFWKSAWIEIRRSRGEAIQAGFQEHEIVEEHLIEIFRNLLPQIRENALENADFRIAIPASTGFVGYASFFRVCGVEEGLSVPETELKVIRELRTIDQWRD